MCQGVEKLGKYISDNYILRTDDALQRWYNKKDIYLRLFLIAKQRLCIPASFGVNEFFQKVKKSDRRSRLSTKIVSQVMFLNST